MVNAAVQRMVSAALWLSPLGVGSLVAASILRACDLLGGWGRAGWVGGHCLQGTWRQGAAAGAVALHLAGCTRHSHCLFGWLDR